MIRNLRSLRFRLLLLIMVVLAITGGIAAVLASNAITERFEQYLLYQQAASIERRRTLSAVLPDLLASHYQANGSWTGIAPLLTPLVAATEERVLLADTGGTVLVDSSGQVEGQPLPADRGERTPIRVGTEVVGTLVVMPLVEEESTSNERAFIMQVNRALLWAVLAAGIVGALLSLAMARRILKPVEALTAAARRMEQGDLQQRVDVRTGDEIGELAHAFNAMADSLARAEQLRRNMVSDIAHELRTPLSNIRGYLEAVQDGVVQPTAQMIESLYEEAMLLNRLINDLQELALADAGRLQLYFQEISMADLVAKTVKALDHPGNGNEIDLHLQIPSDLPPVVADPERVGQVLRNLLSNAYAYTPPGGAVVVSAQTRDGTVFVSVRNSGEGIPPEHLPYLFERFYRADRSRTRATGGSGLGLAIVKQLVEAHGGHVWVENVPDWGVQFTFSIPATRTPIETPR